MNTYTNYDLYVYTAFFAERKMGLRAGVEPASFWRNTPESINNYAIAAPLVEVESFIPLFEHLYDTRYKENI